MGIIVTHSTVLTRLVATGISHDSRLLIALRYFWSIAAATYSCAVTAVNGVNDEMRTPDTESCVVLKVSFGGRKVDPI